MTSFSVLPRGRRTLGSLASTFTLAGFFAVVGCGSVVVEPPTTGTGSCASPETACAGSCVDTRSDTTSCGSCGHDCQGGTCVEGSCQPVTVASGQNNPGGI